MRRLLIGPLAASAAIAAMLVGSATAASASHTVQIGGSASLVGKGAAVTVPVTVTCAPSPSPFPGPFPSPFPPPPPSSSRVAVQVTERSGSRIAQGYGSANVVCDNTPHTVDVLVTAQGAPFKHGDAVATATMVVCDYYFYSCHNATDTETIQVGK